MSDAALLPVLQPPADGVQPRAVVFEILRPGDRIPGPQQMLRQCGQGPYFVLKAHMLVVGDGAALAGMFIPAAAEFQLRSLGNAAFGKCERGDPFPVLLLDLPGQRLVLLCCCRHPPFFQTVVEAVDLRNRLEDRVSVLRRHGIEFPDAALAVHFFGRTQIGVQLVQRGGSGIFVSAHRVQIATQQVDQLLFLGNLCLSAPRADRNFAKSTYASIHSRYFVSAHRLQIATANVHKAPRADLWNAL